MTSKIQSSLALLVSSRAGKRCEYCHAPQKVVGQSFHFDHIRPSSTGGETSAENLCLACPHCNLVKGIRTQGVDPKTGKLVQLFNPRTDNWDEHFRWSADYERLIGLTAIGRTTIATLQMNDVLLQDARPFWHAAGYIP